MAVATKTRKDNLHTDSNQSEIYRPPEKKRGPGRPPSKGIQSGTKQGRAKQPATRTSKTLSQYDLTDLEERRERLREIKLQMSVGDLFLSGMSIEEIAELLDTDVETTVTQLRMVEDYTHSRLAVLAERVTYLNLARMERLMSIWYPIATQADREATAMVIKIQDSEREWAERVSSKGDKRQVDALYDFENTVSTQGDLYLAAATSMDDEWLRDAEIAIVDLYEQEIPVVDEAGLNEKIRQLEHDLGFGEENGETG